MAKRLTDTDKWKDEWYISLCNDDKIVWQWLLDNCSHAGVCKPSMTLLNMMCRVSYDEKVLLEKMSGRVIPFNNIWFIPKFIKFQYKTLFSQKPVIVSVVKELFNFYLIEMIPSSFGDDYKIISNSFNNHCQMIKDKDKDKDKDTKGGMGGKIKGVRFNENKTGVFFEDGSYQEFGAVQKQEADWAKPPHFIKGSTY